MSPNVNIDPKVKIKLDEFKNDFNIKTYSDAVNFLIINNQKLEELLKTVQENNELLKENLRMIRDMMEKDNKK